MSRNGPTDRATSLDVVLDLEELTAIGSLALAALMDFRHRLRRRRRDLRIARAQAEVWSAFCAVRLNEMFARFETIGFELSGHRLMGKISDVADHAGDGQSDGG